MTITAKPSNRKEPERFEKKPRWPGAPKICLKARLPSFETKEKYNDWHERNGPGCTVVRVWLCDFCQHYHADTIAPDPAGASSGNGRSSRMMAFRRELEKEQQEQDEEA